MDSESSSDSHKEDVQVSESSWNKLKNASHSVRKLSNYPSIIDLIHHVNILIAARLPGRIGRRQGTFTSSGIRSRICCRIRSEWEDLRAQRIPHLPGAQGSWRLRIGQHLERHPGQVALMNYLMQSKPSLHLLYEAGNLFCSFCFFKVWGKVIIIKFDRIFVLFLSFSSRMFSCVCEIGASSFMSFLIIITLLWARETSINLRKKFEGWSALNNGTSGGRQII